MTDNTKKYFSFDNYNAEVSKSLKQFPSQRYGQALFNVLYEVRPELANDIRGTELDPYHCAEGDKIDLFFKWLHERMEGETND